MSQHTEASASSSAENPVASRFGMPQALVLLGFLAATVVLRLVADMTIHDIVVLLTAAGSIGVAVLVAASIRNVGGRLLRRLIKAALTSGSGS
ncbi:hypothetical protein [Streptomyces sp. NPDC052015]|uniref:hypothetical protein n=1 Tax=Streptomyces sp. NPDC052015 TaxID=3154755 RepID=UPI00341B576F